MDSVDWLRVVSNPASRASVGSTVPTPALSEWAQITKIFLMLATAGFYGW